MSFPSTAFNLDLATFHGQLKSLVSGEDSMFCDVRIKCDGGVVAANQLVLAAGSKVFKHALTRYYCSGRSGNLGLGQL